MLKDTFFHAAKRERETKRGRFYYHLRRSNISVCSMCIFSCVANQRTGNNMKSEITLITIIRVNIGKLNMQQHEIKNHINYHKSEHREIEQWITYSKQGFFIIDYNVLQLHIYNTPLARSTNFL